ncbi:prepilin peptidase [Candidatus Saccharibacteria bacterium]|nr:prepilin peptidase [Candidatus Saccharibacteria bacterium]
MIILLLIVAGLGLGSFVNALIWRVYQQEKAKSKAARQKLSILRGRSMCVHCKHQLATADLIPVLSWLWLRGKCRYCKKPISWQYPVVEIATALIFVGSYVFWPVTLDNTGTWLLFITWLVSSVGLIALLVYDLRWMLLPNRIVHPTFFVALIGRLSYIVFFAEGKAHSFWLLVFSLVISSGVFWLMFQVSRGQWIGFGDVRLGLITGTLLADPAKSAAMIFIASLLGSLVALPGLITGKKTMSSKLPYGPFLIIATGIALLFGSPIIDWYKSILGL